MYIIGSELVNICIYCDHTIIDIDQDVCSKCIKEGFN